MQNNASSGRTASGSAPPTPNPKRARSVSPAPPPARPETPPPTLPPPTLSDLGLTLSTVTAKLLPSHFSSPPTSGAFLAPNYLLLCHAQGLDVLPLSYPPLPQPYALVRRVSFKSVVVMEHRGVLVAIAGRRDGVRVYALEEVKKAVEWRIEVEIRREREKARKEEAKKGPSSASRFGLHDLQTAGLIAPSPGNRTPKSPLATTSKPETPRRTSKTPPVSRQSSHTGSPVPPVVLPPPPVPATEPPPAYTGMGHARRTSTVSTSPRAVRARATSVSEALAAPIMDIPPMPSLPRVDPDAKGDWVEQSMAMDEEAIDIVAAGPSGSQALDERTSAAAARAAGGPIPPSSPPTEIAPTIPLARTRTSATIRRTGRPTDLDLSSVLPEAEGDSPAPEPQPSPVPTLMTMRQALASRGSHAHVPSVSSLAGIASQQYQAPNTPDVDIDEDEDEEMPQREQLTLAQMLADTRIPDLPPPGTRRPQQPILITSSHRVASPEPELPSPRASESPSVRSRRSAPEPSSSRRRRRWSVLGGIFPPPPTASNTAAAVTSDAESQSESSHQNTIMPPPPIPPTPRAEPTAPNLLRRPTSARASGHRTMSEQVRPRASASVEALGHHPDSSSVRTGNSQGGSRLISRILNSALHPRRSGEERNSIIGRHTEAVPAVPGHNAPAPKLEYVKLPGTKGALMIKSVETAKKR